MTYEQYQFILRLSKNVEDYLKITKANDEILKTLRENFEAHLSAGSGMKADPMSENQLDQNKIMDMIGGVKENKISIESEVGRSQQEEIIIARSMLTAIINLCKITGIKKIEVVYNKNNK